MTDKARILFVDDERRVLNAMRGLFRRDYELFLTSEGAEAVKIAVENDVDVIVADQRMPGMTGIEVLSAVKQKSPRTVRILLTGYADPTAVEGSINLGEVFRFLSKPCPPKILRETLSLAIDAARTKPEVPAAQPEVPVTQAEAPVAQPEAPAAPKPQTTPPSPAVDTQFQPATPQPEIEPERATPPPAPAIVSPAASTPPAAPTVNPSVGEEDVPDTGQHCFHGTHVNFRLTAAIITYDSNYTA